MRRPLRRFPFCLLVLGSLLAPSVAQQKSARAYYEEAKEAGALPSYPYVCFRTTMGTSVSAKEGTYDEPTFAMIGTSRQVADIIRRKAYAQMTVAERDKLKALEGTDFLFMALFTHGVNAGDQVFDNASPSDPSRAAWILEGTLGEKKVPVKWGFNINWGTLRFQERVSKSEGYLIFYGQSELVGTTR